ncbi:MAG TPA: tellurite resistance/C4-dicarboxylate transporter family protein, partial [Longimicrobiales bacterium]|nr:tellurite resistance/C4-dicarboxylate transporter family protein [Longimicrobiales bacterium]
SLMPAHGTVLLTARDLPPGAFSVVMATGIVSTAGQLLGWHAISWPLFALNILFYAVLLILLAVRCSRFPARVGEDFRAHARSAGFFTVVAATAVVGTELVLRVSMPTIAFILWGAAILLWLVLIYSFFAVMTVLPEKPALDAGMNASWMLLVVSTQSVSLLGTLLSPALGSASDVVLGFTTCMFLIGCMFYILLFSLILYRFLFFPLDATGVSPPYWINMGAVAITTLAGSLLVIRAPDAPVLAEVRPFILGFTLLFWATATWWFPLLILLGAWRHGLERVPIRYDVQYWSMVFPLGMYTVATIRLSEAVAWPFLQPIARVVGVFALIAWALAFAGLLTRIVRPRAGAGRAHGTAAGGG